MSCSLAILFGFGFANLPMLWWLAAAGAPLVIHLLSRRKYREVSWAAIEFLLAAMKKNTRRMLIEQWLLLAVRTLILILAALAAGEAFLELAGGRFLPGKRTHRVLVLDGSYSMGLVSEETTLFDRAREIAHKIVRESPEGDGFTVLLLASPPRAVVATPAFDREAVIEELNRLVMPHGSADLSATLRKVQEVLEEARRDQPRLQQEEVVILTDLGRSSWVTAERGASELAALRAAAAQLAESTHLALIDVGQPAAENVALVDLRVVESVITPRRELSIEAELKHFGRDDVPRQSIEFLIDGRRVGEGTVDLEPGGLATAAIVTRFETAGSHLIEARISGDALDVDNHRYAAVEAVEEWRVLVINGRPAGEAFQGASDYLAVALEPAVGRRQGPVRVDVRRENALLDSDLQRYAAVFLADVAQFTADEAAILDRYVRGGGGLVLFLGGQVQPANYNRRLGGAPDGGVRLLPGKLSEGPAIEGDFFFDPLDYQHELTWPFRGNEKSGLITAHVSRFIPLSLAEDSAAKVALSYRGSLAQGAPAVVEEAVGRGRVLLITTSADTRWSTLPVGPAYVPLVQELLHAALRGRRSDQNVTVGQSLTGTVATSPADIKVDLETPQNQRIPLRLSDEAELGRWSFGETWLSGRYLLHFGSPLNTRAAYAVNVDPREGDLAKLSVEELQSEVWGEIPFTYSTAWKKSTDQPAAEIVRRGSLARWFLYPLLALLLLEPLLAWRFAGGRK